MIGDVEIGHDRLAEALVFHIFAVIPADGDRGVDDIGDDHHALPELGLQLADLLFKRLALGRHFVDGCLGLLGKLLFALGHMLADLLADGVPLIAQLVAAGGGPAALLVESGDLIDKGKLVELEFLADILFHKLRVGADKFDVDHK